jgi:hypothetical protein
MSKHNAAGMFCDMFLDNIAWNEWVAALNFVPVIKTFDYLLG